MTCRINSVYSMLAAFLLIVVSPPGCTKQEAAQALQKTEAEAEAVANEVAENVEMAAEKGQQVVQELGSEAAAYLTSLKDDFGNLEALKEAPEELKAKVAELIATIEQRAGEITIPESVRTALATVQEKLVALRDYLEGEIEQAKVDEHIKGITESVDAMLGLSQQ